MTDTTQDSPQPGFDRRRFIKASAGGAALVWAAPTITGLDARAFAAGSDPDCLKGLSDDFDQEGAGRDFGPGYATVTTLANFDVGGGNVDIIGTGGSGGGNDLVPGNGYYVDLDGTGNTSGSVTLTSKRGFCAGTYSVSITYAGNKRSQGNAPDTLSVNFGGSIFTVVLNASDGPTTSMIPGVTVTDGTKLIISQSPVGDNQGALLLSVSVS